MLPASVVVITGGVGVLGGVGGFRGGEALCLCGTLGQGGVVGLWSILRHTLWLGDVVGGSTA